MQDSEKTHFAAGTLLEIRFSFGYTFPSHKHGSRLARLTLFSVREKKRKNQKKNRRCPRRSSRSGLPVGTDPSVDGRTRSNWPAATSPFSPALRTGRPIRDSFNFHHKPELRNTPPGGHLRSTVGTGPRQAGPTLHGAGEKKILPHRISTTVRPYAFFV